MSLRTLVLVAALLVVPTILVAPTSEACATSLTAASAGVPCGRIYPIILMKIADQQPSYPVAQGVDYSFDTEFTYKFNIAENGYTAASDPILINFEYPRKPDWVDILVEPDTFEVPVNNPTYLQPNLADPNNPQADYEYKQPVKITVRLNGEQPVLRDGYEFAKLLIFAKSTESGLYQSGYGIKEIRVKPNSFVYESDIAGSRDVFTATPLTTTPLSGGSTTVGATTVTFTPPAEVAFWQSSPYTVTIDPAPTGRMAIAITEESGALIGQWSPPSATSTYSFNATLVHPGRHTATVTLLPDATSASRAPASFVIPFDAGDVTREGFAYPKSYLLVQTNHVPLPSGNVAPTDAGSQFEQDIPFFAFDTAQSTVASLTLATPSVGLDRTVASLTFAIIDAEGKQIQINSVDPSNPTRSIRIGSLPGDGWYVLKVRGVGLPSTASYVARVEASYSVAPEARNHADGFADITGGVLALGGRNVTLPTSNLGVWAPTAFQPTVDGFPDVAYVLTIHDDAGRIAFASGKRTAGSTFTAPAPGLYHATVYSEPSGGEPFAPTTRAFTFRVGDGTAVVATTFEIQDTFSLPATVQETLVAIYQVPTPLATSAGTLVITSPPGATVRVAIVDREGHEVASEAAPATGLANLALSPDGGPYQWLVYASNAAAPGTFGMSLTRDFGGPVTLDDPSSTPDSPTGKSPIPSLAVGMMLGAFGLVAVSVALLRRK